MVNWDAGAAVEPKLPGSCSVKVIPIPSLSAAFYDGRGNDGDKARIVTRITQYAETDLNRKVFSGEAGPDCSMDIALTFFGTHGLESTYRMEGDVRLKAGKNTVANYRVSGSWVGDWSNVGDNSRCEDWAIFDFMNRLKAELSKNSALIMGKMQGTGAFSAAAAGSGAGEGSLMTIAVSDLSPEGVSQSDASIVADWLRGALVSTGTYTVVERNAMQKILSEQVFQNTGCTSSDCAVKLGKVLNVKRMVVGSFGKFIDSYVLNVRVVDIESGKIVYSDSANGATTREVEANIKALAQRLSK